MARLRAQLITPQLDSAFIIRLSFIKGRYTVLPAACTSEFSAGLADWKNSMF